MASIEEQKMNIIDRRGAIKEEGAPINVIKVGLFAILFLSVLIGTSLYLTADDTAEVKAEYNAEFDDPMPALSVGPLYAEPSISGHYELLMNT